MSDRLLPSGQWLKDRLSTRWVGKSEIIYEEEIPSTNTLLKELARQGAPAGTVAVCDFQSAGRGRLQRVWKAAAGETLPVSLLLKPRLTPEQIPLCTLGAAVAASQAIEQVCPGLKAGIKWPNDVVISGRKCVGILCEGAFDPEGRLCVIMGVGFNGNQREFPPELSASATSLFLEKQRCDPAAAPVVLRELLAAFLEAVERVIDRLEAGGIPCPFGDDRLYGTGHCAHGGIHRSSGGHGRRRGALSPGCFRLFTGGRLRRRIRPRSHGLHPRGSAPGPRTAPIGRGALEGKAIGRGFTAVAQQVPRLTGLV